VSKGGAVKIDKICRPAAKLLQLLRTSVDWSSSGSHCTLPGVAISAVLLGGGTLAKACLGGTN